MNTVVKFFLISFLFPFFIFAEESGRLPDGRAFRTDSDGMQLVDYIAELEVQIEEQKGEIVELQNELIAQRGEGSSFVEKDLVSGKMAVAKPNTLPAGCDCSSEVQLCESRLFSARSDKEELTRELAMYKTTGKVPSRIKVETQNVSTETTPTSKPMAPLAKNVTQVKESKPKIQPRPIAAKKASLSTKRLNAMRLLEANIKTGIAQLDKAIKRRDNLYGSYSAEAKSKSLAFNLAKLKTKQGYTPTKIKKDLKQASTFAELSRIQKNLVALTKLVKADISLLKRLSK